LQKQGHSENNRKSPSTAIPELLYPETAMPIGAFLKKTPPFTAANGARKFWNRSIVHTSLSACLHIPAN
jgi:hypothetical protein